MKSLLLSRRSECLAFAREYEALAPRVRAFLFRYGFKDDLDDLVQDVFERAWKKRRSFQKQSKFSSWIMRIAVNVAIDQQRKRNVWARFLGRYKQAIPVSAKAPELETRQAIELAFSRLPERLKLVAVLVLVEGYQYKEAAEITSLPLGSVKSLASEARRYLMDELDRLGVTYEI